MCIPTCPVHLSVRKSNIHMTFEPFPPIFYPAIRNPCCLASQTVQEAVSMAAVAMVASAGPQECPHLTIHHLYSKGQPEGLWHLRQTSLSSAPSRRGEQILVFNPFHWDLAPDHSACSPVPVILSSPGNVPTLPFLKWDTPSCLYCNTQSSHTACSTPPNCLRTWLGQYLPSTITEQEYMWPGEQGGCFFRIKYEFSVEIENDRAGGKVRCRCPQEKLSQLSLIDGELPESGAGLGAGSTRGRH